MLIEYCRRPNQSHHQRSAASQAAHIRIVQIINGGETYNGAHSEREDLVQAHVAVEERDLGWAAGRLLEREPGVRVRPVLVVALRRQVDVEAVSRAHTHMREWEANADARHRIGMSAHRVLPPPSNRAPVSGIRV